MSILIVDDEPNIRMLLSEIVQMKGFSPDTAENGQIAVEMVKEKSYKLILLDHRMPVLSGEKALVQLRAFTDAPIIMITAFQTRNELGYLFDEGITDVLMKPFNVTDVIAIIEKYVN